MNEIIANCGLDCSTCDAYIARRTDDQEVRQKAASNWSEMYLMDISPDEINCDGCNSEGGVLYGHCLICTIRLCCKERHLSHCADCEQQPCVKLAIFHSKNPEARASFEKYLVESIE